MEKIQPCRKCILHAGSGYLRAGKCRAEGQESAKNTTAKTYIILLNNNIYMH
jgi:hypothetical protein